MSSITDVCKHRFVMYKSESYTEEATYHGIKAVIVNYFYCEYCLEMREKEKSQTFSYRERENLPSWAKTITNVRH